MLIEDCPCRKLYQRSHDRLLHPPPWWHKTRCDLGGFVGIQAPERTCETCQPTGFVSKARNDLARKCAAENQVSWRGRCPLKSFYLHDRETISMNSTVWIHTCRIPSLKRTLHRSLYTFKIICQAVSWHICGWHTISKSELKQLVMVKKTPGAWIVGPKWCPKVQIGCTGPVKIREAFYVKFT